MHSQSIESAQNALADAMTTYADRINGIVDAGNVNGLPATSNITNAIGNLVTAHSRSLGVVLSAVAALAVELGRTDIAAGEGGFEVG